MATRDELMIALRAADAAGDVQGAQRLAQLIASQPAEAPSGPADQPELKDYGLRDFATDVGKGAVASAANIGQTLLTPVGWVSDDARDYLARSREISDQMRKEAGAPGMIGGLAVDIAGTGGMGGIAKHALTKAAAYLPRARAAMTAAPTLAAAEGTMSGAYLSPDDPMKGAAVGGVGGVAGQQILSRTLGRIAKPINLEKHGDTDALMQRGIPMTVGLGADPSTLTGKALRGGEELLAAAPVIGGAIRGQRELARQGFREAPLRELSEKIRVPAPVRGEGGSTTQMLEELEKSIGKRYENLLQGKNIKPSTVMQRNLDAIVGNPKLSMVPADRQRARNLVEAHIYDRMKQPGLEMGPLPQSVKASDLFKAQSDLRRLGYKAMRSDISSENAFGQALVDSADEIYATIQRRYPKMGKELQDLRGPYRELSTLKAASEKAAPRGEFSPTQLGRVASGRGDEELRDFAAMAEPLLTKDTGGISKMAGLSLLLGGGVLAGPASIPPALMAYGLLGTRGGQRALQGDLGWQRAMAKRLQDNPELVNRLSAIMGREAALGASAPEDLGD